MSVELENEVLSGQEVSEALKNAPGWQLEDKALQKTFKCNSFLEAIAFVNRVAVAAEKMNHHPDFAIHYRQVTLRCWTHKSDAITRADLKLVEEIEAVA
jgi:4a-hydroxytetrahydrobiopterin dehydratase